MNPQITLSNINFTTSFDFSKNEIKKTLELHSHFGFSKLGNLQNEIPLAQKTALKFQHLTNFVHVGMGGSALGPEVLLQSLAHTSMRNNGFQKTFTFLKNLDPLELKNFFHFTKLENTLFFIVSKSGETLETHTLLTILIEKLQNHYRQMTPELSLKNILQKHFVFCTDPEKGTLRQLSKKYDIDCFTIPPNLGGRFSVLSPVSFLPLCFFQLDPIELMKGAENMQASLLGNKNIFFEELAKSIVEFALYHQLTQTLMMPYSTYLKTFTDWFVQLWAESLGKKQLDTHIPQGLTPIASYGPADQHSQLQLFLAGPKKNFTFFLSVQNDQIDFVLPTNSELQEFKSLTELNNLNLEYIVETQLIGVMEGFRAAQLPYVHLQLKQLNLETFGELFYFFESLTASVGHLLNVNPFDQPEVEIIKKQTQKMLMR